MKFKILLINIFCFITFSISPAFANECSEDSHDYSFDSSCTCPSDTFRQIESDYCGKKYSCKKPAAGCQVGLGVCKTSGTVDCQSGYTLDNGKCYTCEKSTSKYDTTYHKCIDQNAESNCQNFSGKWIVNEEKCYICHDGWGYTEGDSNCHSLCYDITDETTCEATTGCLFKDSICQNTNDFNEIKQTISYKGGNFNKKDIQCVNDDKDVVTENTSEKKDKEEAGNNDNEDSNCNGTNSDGIYACQFNSDKTAVTSMSKITDYKGRDSNGNPFKCQYTRFTYTSLLQAMDGSKTELYDVNNAVQRDKVDNALKILKQLGLHVRDGVYCLPDKIYEYQRFFAAKDSSGFIYTTEQGIPDEKNYFLASPIATVIPNDNSNLTIINENIVNFGDQDD